MNTTTRRSLGFALICFVLAFFAVVAYQYVGVTPRVLLNLLADALIVLGLVALLVTGVALVRRR